MSSPYYPPATLVKGNCDDLTKTTNNNCFFAYSEAKFDRETEKLVLLGFIVAICLLCLIIGIANCIRKTQKKNNNSNSDPQYSSTSAIVATGNEHRSNYSTVQQVSVSPDTQPNHEPERMYESPQKPKINNQENYSPYQHAQPSYYSLNNDQ